MTIKNILGKTKLLRSLEVGDRVTWYCDGTLADPDMRRFTAIIHTAKLGITVKQCKALLVTPDNIPVSVIILERTA